MIRRRTDFSSERPTRVPAPPSLALLALGLLVSLGDPGAACAQSGSSDAEARSLFDAGRVAFADGRYEQALERFQEAHTLSGRPELLYNVALCHDRLGQVTGALAAYRAYLESVPDAENRREVEDRIAALASPAGAAPPPEAAVDPAPWVLLGVSGAVAVTGAILFGVGFADVSSVSGAPDGTPWRDVSGTAERGVILEGVGLSALVAGIVGAGIGLVWAVQPRSESSAVALRLTPGGLSLEGPL